MPKIGPVIDHGSGHGDANRAAQVTHECEQDFLRIAEHLNASNTQMAGWLHCVTGQYTHAWGDACAGRAAALNKVWEFARREVLVQAFADAFLMIAVCFVLSAVRDGLPMRTQPPAPTQPSVSSTAGLGPQHSDFVAEHNYASRHGEVRDVQ